MVKRIAAAAERNSAPIFEVLNRILPEGCAVLEVSSGSGQHGAYVTAHRSDVTWQPSDIGDDELASIAAWRAEVRRPNLLAPMKLDARAPKWPVEVAGARFDAVVCINMIHIAPWECCLGLIGGAARILSPGGLLYLYGPYAIHGTFNAPSKRHTAFQKASPPHNG